MKRGATFWSRVGLKVCSGRLYDPVDCMKWTFWLQVNSLKTFFFLLYSYCDMTMLFPVPVSEKNTDLMQGCQMGPVELF